MNNKRLSLILTIVSLLVSFSSLTGQQKPNQYLNGIYQEYYLKSDGIKFKVFDFVTSQRSLKTVYFGNEGKEKYKNWKKRNRGLQVLCFFAVGFSKDLEDNNTPIGLCLENGKILNRTLEKGMDGIVIIDKRGNLTALDIDHERFDGRYALRKASDKSYFINYASRNRLSVFQTQLLYSEVGGSKIGPLKYGKKAARRFLAICKDRAGQEHQIVLNLPVSTHLNRAAQAAVNALQDKGYDIQYLLNQDTGSRNILTAYDEDEKELYSAPVDLKNATQLLVYYKSY